MNLGTIIGIIIGLVLLVVGFLYWFKWNSKVGAVLFWIFAIPSFMFAYNSTGPTAY